MSSSPGEFLHGSLKPEERITYENEALTFLWGYITARQRYPGDTASFEVLAGSIQTALYRSIAGIARCRPEHASFRYMAQNPDGGSTERRVTGPAAYESFYDLTKIPAEVLGETKLPDIWTHLLMLQIPMEGSRLVRAIIQPKGLMTFVSTRKCAIGENGELHAALGAAETEIHLSPESAWANLPDRNDERATQLVLNRRQNKFTLYPPDISGGIQPVSPEQVAPWVKDPASRQVFDEYGLYGLTAFRIWQCARDLRVSADLPPDLT